jgi:lysozyme
MTTNAASLHPSAACIELVKHFEGCVLAAYPDPATHADPWTIGYGHTGKDVHKGLIWSQDEADAALAADLNRTAFAVQRLVDGYETSQSEFDAFCSFAFNVGVGNLASSTLLKKHRAGAKEGAAQEFQKWVNAGGHRMEGLVKRRDAEAELYRGNPS